MRLLESLPDLPTGEGYLDAHNSGGEHAIRYSGIEDQYNRLRRAELAPLAKPGLEVADFDHVDFLNMMLSDKYEVIIAQQVEIPPTHGHRLAGVAIGERARTGEFTKTMTVSEVVVHPELRRRHIASYMLSRLTQNLPFSVSLTEMIVATDTFSPDPSFVEGLAGAGFRHSTPNGSPAVWLPGQAWAEFVHEDTLSTMKLAEKHIPAYWNGYRAFNIKDDPQVRVYREGALLGIVRQAEDTDHYDETIRRSVADFTVSDAGDVALDTLKGVTEKEAVIGILNNYELLDNAA